MDGVTFYFGFFRMIWKREHFYSFRTNYNSSLSCHVISWPKLHTLPLFTADKNIFSIWPKKLNKKKNKKTQNSGGSRIFQMGGRCFVANGGAHILFSGKKCMKLKEIGLKWGGARLLAPCYSKITIFLWIILNSIMKTSYFTYLRIFWDILYKIIF